MTAFEDIAGRMANVGTMNSEEIATVQREVAAEHPLAI